MFTHRGGGRVQLTLVRFFLYTATIGCRSYKKAKQSLVRINPAIPSSCDVCVNRATSIYPRLDQDSYVTYNLAIFQRHWTWKLFRGFIAHVSRQSFVFRQYVNQHFKLISAQQSPISSLKKL